MGLALDIISIVTIFIVLSSFVIQLLEKNFKSRILYVLISAIIEVTIIGLSIASLVLQIQLKTKYTITIIIIVLYGLVYLYEMFRLILLLKEKHSSTKQFNNNDEVEIPEIKQTEN